MKQASVDDLKKIQLEILDYVANFCDKNDIKYFLDSGTLLGAIRHKGYIPWDDDIDIGMLREDYDKFINLFNNDNDSKYKCYSIENNENFYFPFAKVLDTTTVLYEPNEKGFKFCINIDVFVYDNAPDNTYELKKMYDSRDKLIKKNTFRGFKFYKSYSFIKLIIKFLLYFYTFFRDRNHYAKKLVENSKKYSNIETGYVGNFTSFSRIKARKEIFNSFIEVDFEGKKYKAPVGYDEWLKNFYGDYMQLPPKEKRVSHHSFVAYYKED